MNAQLARRLGRTQGASYLYPVGGGQAEPMAEPGVAASIAVPGAEFTGRVSAAMLGALWLSLLGFYMLTRRYQF